MFFLGSHLYACFSQRQQKNIGAKTAVKMSSGEWRQGVKEGIMEGGRDGHWRSGRTQPETLQGRSCKLRSVFLSSSQEFKRVGNWGRTKELGRRVEERVGSLTFTPNSKYPDHEISDISLIFYD